VMDRIGSKREFDRHVSQIIIDRSVFSRETEMRIRKIVTDQLSVS
jgi:hypothetical protein